MDREIAAAIAAIEAKITILEESRDALVKALGVDAPKRRGRPAGRRKAGKGKGKRARRGENRDKVLAVVSSKPMAVKDISAQSGVPSPGVNAVLMALVKAGRVQKAGRGQYKRKGRAAR